VIIDMHGAETEPHHSAFYTGFEEHERKLAESRARVERAAAAGNKASQTILDEAKNIISGPRRESYGHPTPNHQAIATLWNAFLDNRRVFGMSGPLSPQEVATMMCLLKIARLQYTPDHADSLLDAISYLALVDVMNEGGQ
jgi:hypothetical protein